ncbi:MAG: hypothetical protein Q9187_002694 [Circinaria calcarea]
MESFLGNGPRTNQQTGFTPVRRRHDTDPYMSPTVYSKAPWTTSRCNRLLRPISSRVVLLRKHKLQPAEDRNNFARAVPFAKNQPNTRDHNETLRAAESRQPLCERLDKKDHDPDWAPEDGPRKRLKRTYSSKSGLQFMEQARTRRLRSIDIARDEDNTQLPLLRNRNETQSAMLFQSFMSKPQVLGTYGRIYLGNRPIRGKSRIQGKGSHATVRESVRRLAKSVSPSEWMLVDGLYNALDALLKATTGSKIPANSGAPSLFSSCLRKIPHYIIQEQRMIGVDDPDPDTDVTSEIFADLESYGLSECGGWKPLREIVRAHGIAILGAAIEDGFINASIARGLVLLCTQASAYSEAEHLIQSLITVTRPLPEPRSLSERLFTTNVCLGTLNDFYYRTERHSFFYRQLTVLLSSRIIPVEWISSYDMVDCWNQVMGHIIAEDSHIEEATLLLQCAVSMAYTSLGTPISNTIHLHRLQSRASPRLDIQAYGRKDSLAPKDAHPHCILQQSDHQESSIAIAITSTITNLLTVLLSIGIVHSDARGTDSLPTHSAILRGLAIDAQQHYELSPCPQSQIQELGMREARLAIVLLAHGISDLTSITSEPTHIKLETGWLDTISEFNEKAKMADRLSSFCCAVAHCCDRAGPKDGFEHLQNMLQCLLDLPFSQVGSAMRSLIRHIAMDAAFEFAEGTNQKDQLNWALELEENLNAECRKADGKILGRTPARASMKPSAGFRWEEGICEWIARTPAVALAQTKADQSSGGLCRILDQDQAHGPMDKSPSLNRRPTCQQVSSMVLDGENEGMIASLPTGRPSFPDLCSTPLKRVLSDNIHSYESKPRLSHVRRKSPIGEGNQARIVQGVHVFDDDTDELSTHESSQEPQYGGRRPVLRELSNLASKICQTSTGKRKAGSSRHRSVLSKHRRTQSGLLWEMGENVSEDELGV